MKIHLILGEVPWKGTHDHNLPNLIKLQEGFLKLFAAYEPTETNIAGTYGYRAYEMAAAADDSQLEKLVKQFDEMLKQTKPPAAAVLKQSPTPDEVSCTRLLEPYYYSDYVDEGSSREPLNGGLFLCKECNYPDLTHFPEPFLVNRSVLKKYDLFPET